MWFGRDVRHPDEDGQMSVTPLEQLDSLDHREEFRSRAILQASITEAFALLNAGARHEAIAQIKQTVWKVASIGFPCGLRRARI
jgi:hypothetical protein